MSERLEPIFDDATAEGLVAAAGLVAEIANRLENPPFGCLLVQKTEEGARVVEFGENTTYLTGDAMEHAEMRALKEAQKLRGDRNIDLSTCALVANIESCPGCFCFALKSGIEYFYFGGHTEETAQPYIPLSLMVDTMRKPIHLWYSGVGFWEEHVKNARRGGIANVSARVLLAESHANHLVNREEPELRDLRWPVT